MRKIRKEVANEEVVDLVIAVDDGSLDETVSIAKSLPDTLAYNHDRNRGYGGNQKSYYKLAIEKKGDILSSMIPEITCPTKYFPEACSINLPRSIICGIGCLLTAFSYRLPKIKLITSRLFPYEV